MARTRGQTIWGTQLMKPIKLIILLFIASIVNPGTLSAKDYDLVILNGRVMDPESNLDEIRNVGIKDGKIAVITKKNIRGKESIDASNHVVAPGFIDGHHHNVVVPFGRRLALRDGVTTPLELEVGVLPVDKWYASMEGKSATNFGATASIMAAREFTLNPKFKSKTGTSLYDLEDAKSSGATMNWSTTVATDAQIDEILAKVEKGVKQGALGVGAPIGYMVDGISQRETYGAQVIAGKYGLLTGLHGRFSGQNRSASGIRESMLSLERH